jgi:hypothetical protein
MNSKVQDARPARTRSPLWRAVQLVAGIALFLYALRLLDPQPVDRPHFVLLAALLAAGAMSLTDAVVGLLATIIEKFQKGPKA